MKKTLKIIQSITIIIVIGVIILVASSAMFNNNGKSMFGYNGFVVLSDSMKATDFDAGDLIIVKQVDNSSLQEGDVISYISQVKDNYMNIITHKIRKKVTTETGEPGFITYGTTTGIDDEIAVTYPFIVGKYQFRIPKIGLILQFIKTVPGYILFVAIPFLILIFIQAINTVNSFRKYKKLHVNNLKMERQQIELERQNVEKMIEELRMLQSNHQNSSEINQNSNKV